MDKNISTFHMNEVELQQAFFSLEESFKLGKKGLLLTALELMLCIHCSNLNSTIEKDLRNRVVELESLIKLHLLSFLERSTDFSNPWGRLYGESLFTITKEVISRVTERHHKELMNNYLQKEDGTVLKTTLKNGDTIQVYVEDIDKLVTGFECK